jgi:D-amino-acid dehydrogenase
MEWARLSGWQAGKARSMTQVVVIGGGVAGASTAYHLAKAGTSVTLVDRKDVGHATAAGAGIISPGTSTRPLPAFFPFAQVACAHYPGLIEDLAAIGQTETGYDVVGELILAVSDAEFANLGSLRALYEERRAGGMSHLGEIGEVDNAAAHEMFPALAEIHGALHVPEAARVDGNLLRNALVQGAKHYGAEVRYSASALRVERGKVIGVDLDQDRIAADAVVIAAGAWSNALLSPLGFAVSVEPQRGQILHITMGDTDTSRWPILGGTGDQYMLTFGPNRIVSGATRETGSGFDVRLTVGGLQSVFNHAMRVAPGVAAGTVKEIRIGLRPLSADGLPYIGKVLGHDEVVVVTGHGPSGLQLGPYSGLAAAQLVRGEPVEADLSAFALDRDVSAQVYRGH